MHFWNVSLLESELKAGVIKQRHLFGYYLITIMLFTIEAEISGYFPQKPTMESILSSCIVIFSTLFGTLACYHANHMADDTNFVSRFVALTIPIGVRTIVLLLVFLLIYTIAVRLIFDPPALSNFREKTKIMDAFVPLIFMVGFYAQLYKSIKAVASK